MVIIAGHERYATAEAVEALREYYSKYRPTVSNYDLGGPDEIDVEDQISLADLGRMIFINARLDGRDAANLSQFDLTLYLASLNIDLRLTDVDLHPDGGDSRYKQMVAAYTALRSIYGVSDAKASKLLHLKRPKLFPIIDSRVQAVYHDAARDAGQGVQSRRLHFWLAIQADVQANTGEFADIRTALTATPASRPMIYLSDLRLQDILAWRLG